MKNEDADAASAANLRDRDTPQNDNCAYCVRRTYNVVLYVGWKLQLHASLLLALNFLHDALYTLRIYV